MKEKTRVLYRLRKIWNKEKGDPGTGTMCFCKMIRNRGDWQRGACNDGHSGDGISQGEKVLEPENRWPT